MAKENEMPAVTVMSSDDYIRILDGSASKRILWSDFQPQTGGLPAASDAEMIAGVATNKTATPANVAVLREFYDLRRGGAVGDFSTNCTSAWTAAVAAIPAGGGSILVGPGSWSSDAIPALPSNTTIQGMGRSTQLVHRAGAASGDHFLTVQTNAVRVQIRDVFLNGSRASQTNAVDGIHFTNAAGSSGTNARHVLHNVHVESVKGVGIYLGGFMRACQVDKVSVYFADSYGIQLESFADSQVSNAEVGQSGEHGWYIHGSNTVELSNIRSWFSGRVVTGTGGYGYYVHDGSNIQMSNALSQENSGNGFVFHGVSTPLRGLVVTGALSDADNTVASTFAGFAFNNVEKPIFSGAVRKHSGGVGTPANALSLAGGTTGYVIDLAYSDLSGFPIVGADVGKGIIRLGRLPVAATYAAAYTPQPYTNDTIRMTVAGSLTVNAPNMNPVIPGWRFRTMFKQDATGGRVVTWNAIFKTLGADVTTANLTNIREFEYDGTNWVQVAATLGI